jgi:hypothetical protein
MMTVGCHSAKAPLALDQPLKTGEARAGLVTKASELIGGPAQKAKIGDYKIYNAKVAAIISQAGDGRGYQPYGGVIVEADRVRPAGEAGKSSLGEIFGALDLAVMKATSIEIVSDGQKGGEARIRVHGQEATMPLFDSLFQNLFASSVQDVGWNVDYVLTPDSDAVRIESTMTNLGKPTVQIGLPIVAFFAGAGAPPFMPRYGFTLATASDFAEYYANVGDDVSYIFGRTDAPISVVVQDSGIVVAGNGDGFKLLGRQSTTFSQYLVIGTGDLSKTQDAWRKLKGGAQGIPISGHVVDTSGAPIAGAHVHVVDTNPSVANQDYVTRATTSADGSYAFSVDPGSYKAIVQGPGRVLSDPKAFSASIDAPPGAVDFTLGIPGTIRYSITDDAQKKLPVKISVAPETGNAPNLPERYGERTLAYNLVTTVFAYSGEGAFQVPPGDYHLYISRGAEYEIAEKHISLASAGSASIEAMLARTVKTDGWLSTDTHVHAQLSPDSLEPYPDKVAAMVTEGLEIPVSTDHEAIGDFNPYIRDMGVGDWMQGIVGSEITTFTYGHFNAFPLVADPQKAGNGRISWYGKAPAATFQAIRQHAGDPFLQVNHPRSIAIGGYFSAMGFQAADFTSARPADFSLDFDGIEVANGCDVPFIESQTMLDWFAFLNKGIKKYATGSTDNHHASNGEMGFPRTYVRMPTDDPKSASMDDVRAAFKGGHLTITCGPFVEFSVNGGEIGDLVPMAGDAIEVKARVAAPSWMDVDQLEVVVNGKLEKTVMLDPSMAVGTDRFRGSVWVSMPPGKDAWVILRARGAQPHGVWARNRPSYAFTNPIFLDGNQDGTWTMQ